MTKVDDSAVRILWPFFAVGLMDKPNPNRCLQSRSLVSFHRSARIRALMCMLRVYVYARFHVCVCMCVYKSYV